MSSACQKTTKPRAVINPNQQLLFDSNGYRPFNFFSDVQVDADEPGLFTVGEMSLSLRPPPRNRERAVCATLDVLRLFCLSPSLARFRETGYSDPIRLNGSEYSKCTVHFRKKLDRGTIIARYVRDGDHFHLWLPARKIWKKAGLGWLWAYRDCCARNRDNPTPWQGRSCRCVDS